MKVILNVFLLRISEVAQPKKIPASLGWIYQFIWIEQCFSKELMILIVMFSLLTALSSTTLQDNYEIEQVP